MKKLIVLADWAGDSFTCEEIRIAVEGFLKNCNGANISFVSSTASTIHTSYILRQLVTDIERYGRPLETVIFQNTDPRLHSEKSIEKAAGALPVIIKLKSGIYLTGPNSGYDFSLIKDKIEEAFTYTGVNEKGQFHSRDLYSRISAHLMDYMEDELELEEVGVDVVPTLKGYYIGHIDNFGNIKTTIKGEDFKGKYEYRSMVRIKINNVSKKAKFVDNLFGAIPGELVIYPGSSGENNARYLEITIWRHFTEKNPTTGLAEFDFPKPGDTIELL